VLRVLQQSARTVGAGTVVMVIGDPSRLEVVVDVLSTEAVRVPPGARAVLEAWGGDRGLEARVRIVEPYAFTKVSALGIEEQRVNVVLDPVDPLDRLGDGYKVEARIVVWSADDVLKVPASAVFRRGDGWAVFVAERARARLVDVRVGQRNAREAQILEGLDAGAQVIRYPSNEIADGSRITVRSRR
jgi:HlyD family secretion protein